MWIFLVLFVVSLFAEFIANDRPLYVHYDGRAPVSGVRQLPRDKFGGDFEATADYRDPVVADEIAAHGLDDLAADPLRQQHHQARPADAVAFAADVVADRSPVQDGARRRGPAPQRAAARRWFCRDLEPEWLGTDGDGHDVAAQLLYGFRISVLFGLILAGVSSVVGVAAGAVQGYFGGWTDLIMQRLIEIWSSLPHLYILIILSAILAPSFFVLLIILLLFSWVSLVHVVRAEFFRARNFEYINAARALGLSNFKIIIKHMLPNATVATLTFLPFIINSSIGTLTSLDFLGLGMPPEAPSLGRLLLQGKSNLFAPWLGLSAFAVVALLLSLLIFIGEAVRDAFDPRKTFS